MEHEFNNQQVSPEQARGSPSDRPGEPAFEPGDYRHMLENIEISQEAQDELLTVLWQIMGGFARMAVGLDPFQMLFGRTLENAWENAADGIKEQDNNERDE